MKLDVTKRGFKILKFKDTYDADCSIQESSLATRDAIWIGCDKGLHAEGQCMARMHLDRKLAKMLIKILKFYVRTGYLPEEIKEQK